MIKTFVITVLLIIPSLVIFLNILYPYRVGRVIFTIFVFFIMIERLWETFFSTEERRPYKLYGDWTLVATSISYLIMSIAMLLEFFIIQRKSNFAIMGIGIIIFVFAGFLRFWGIRTLGSQWAVHAVGASKIKKTEITLIKQGPYKYIRHPIYAGIILEVMSLPLIPNCYYTFLFALLINVPMQILRAYYEEQTSMRKFGKEYLDYKKEVPAFLPLKLFKI